MQVCGGRGFRLHLHPALAHSLLIDPHSCAALLSKPGSETFAQETHYTCWREAYGQFVVCDWQPCDTYASLCINPGMMLVRISLFKFFSNGS